MHVIKKGSPDKRFKVVSLSIDAGSGTIAGVKIRPVEGAAEVVPVAAWPEYDEVTESEGGDDMDKVFVEVLGNIRQHSTVRYVLFPFFVTASAVIANAVKSATGEWKENQGAMWAGLGFAILGLIVEALISRNLKLWHEAIEAQKRGVWNDLLFAPRTDLTLWMARLAFLVPYAVLIAYWLRMLFKWSILGAGAVALASVLIGVWILNFKKRSPSSR